MRRGDGEYESIAELWSGSRRTDDPAFLEVLRDLAEAARAGEVDLRFPPHRPPVVDEPGAWNLRGDRAFAKAYPLSWDYLDPRSPNFELKQLEKRLYLSRLGPWWQAVPAGGPVLDVGGGIGRFACEWLDRGHPVTLADPNDRALVLALSHLAARPAGPGRFELMHLCGESLAPLPDDHFWAVTAMEVFCYLNEPERGMAEAARVLRPGGVLMCSVESAAGADQPGATERSVPGDLWVRYFTPDTLRRALCGCGLEVETIFGSHVLPDGPLHHLIDFDRLSDPDYGEALLELEHLLENHPRWGAAGRAWVAVARKPAG